MSVVPAAPSSLFEPNRHVFAFLRARAQFVAQHNDFESLIVWGPVVDAIAAIHARRMQRSIDENRECFHTGLAELVRFIDLQTIAVPLLHQELASLVRDGDQDALRMAKKLFGAAPGALSAHGELWVAAHDVARHAEVIAAADGVTSKAVRRALIRTTYAGVLYADYRCALVHGLDFGWRTWPGSESLGPRATDDVPTYMNFRYREDDPRPAQHRSRVRISFSKPFLVRVLSEMIENEEAECAAQGHVVAPYATRRH